MLVCLRWNAYIKKKRYGTGKIERYYTPVSERMLRLLKTSAALRSVWEGKWERHIFNRSGNLRDNPVANNNLWFYFSVVCNSNFTNQTVDTWIETIL